MDKRQEKILCAMQDENRKLELKKMEIEVLKGRLKDKPWFYGMAYDRPNDPITIYATASPKDGEVPSMWKGSRVRICIIEGKKHSGSNRSSGLRGSTGVTG